MVDVVRRVGLGERLGNSIKGVLIGGVLFLVSFVVLFWNEGRAVKTARGLEEGQGVVVSVPSTSVDPANANKLIHTTGEATADATLADPDFPSVSVKAIRLARTCEIYQWKETAKEETKKNVGGSETVETTYEYNKVWVEEPIDSSSFYHSEGHRNTGSMPVRSMTWTAKKTTVGAFTLPSTLVDELEESKHDVSEAPPGETAPKLNAGGFFIGANPASPEIGDVRITYKVVKPQAVSILGQQVGDTLGPYATSQGTTILRLDPGTLSAAAMFEAAQAENTMMTWILRLVGFLMMLFGLMMVVSPLAVAADVLPFLGNLVRAGTGLVAGLAATALSLVTISIAWLFYRPLIAVPLLLVAVGSAVLLVMKMRKKAAA